MCSVSCRAERFRDYLHVQPNAQKRSWVNCSMHKRVVLHVYSSNKQQQRYPLKIYSKVRFILVNEGTQSWKKTKFASNRIPLTNTRFSPKIHVTCHLLHITCNLSPVCHQSLFFLQFSLNWPLGCFGLIVAMSLCMFVGL